METATYRAYVVRAWTSDPQRYRVTIEVVQSGNVIELRGEEAQRIVSTLAAATRPGSTRTCDRRPRRAPDTETS